MANNYRHNGGYFNNSYEYFGMNNNSCNSNYNPCPQSIMIDVIKRIVMIIVSMNTSGDVAMWSILAVGFFNSIMFPTIFTLAVKGLGTMTSKGSGLVCQGIVGGALIPVIQGMAADSIGIQLSFIVPMLCYIYIGWYALRGADQS